MNLLSTFATLSLVLRCAVAQDTATPTVQPADFAGEDTPYQVIPTGTDIPPGANSTDLSAQNKVGTRLYGYNLCRNIIDPNAKAKIDGAFYDAWVMSNTAGVASGIDWNSAAALDFLGAPGLNKPQQPQIQAVFANVATVIYSYKNPFQHFIKVRCDDPVKRCPCKPTRPNQRLIAYSSNHDIDDVGYPMINFCPAFFDRPSLGEAIEHGKALDPLGRLTLYNYQNRALTFLHELLHLDLAADSPSPNPSVFDLMITWKYGNADQTYTEMAYGALRSKILARYMDTTDTSVGWFVQRNADNLAHYALAKYVTSKLDNVYPHLPLVTVVVDGPPERPSPAPRGTLAEFSKEGGNFFLNTTDDFHTFDEDGAAVIGDNPSCPNNAATETVPAINIDGFAPASAYPDDYNSQVSSWVAALKTASASATPTPSATPPPLPYVPGQCSFHLTETQNCDPASKNLFAIITLKDGAGNDIGDTSVDKTTNPLGQGINDGSSYQFTSKLPKALVVTGEHRPDVIKFEYGGLSWRSDTPSGGASCKVGGWDPKRGPFCGGILGPVEYQFAKKNVDCVFPC